jgi:hypothetical protein
MSGDKNGGQLVSQLMQEINSGTGNETPYNDQDYYPQEQHQGLQGLQGLQGSQGPQGPQGPGSQGPQGPQGSQQQPDFNPNSMVPPPREDDVEEYDDIEERVSYDDSDMSDDDYYKDNNLTEALSQYGGEYTSFIMDLLKNSVIIFIGYIIFSHPLMRKYIMEFAAMVPGLQGFLEVPTYYLAFNGLLFVIFYFVVSYFI